MLVPASLAEALPDLSMALALRLTTLRLFPSTSPLLLVSVGHLLIRDVEVVLQLTGPLVELS